MGSLLRSLLITLACAVGMTLLFWFPLWKGGGLIGGDLYSYYFPQKTYYAESLARGDIPLWNNLVGHGYPVLGESQTGALYPPNFILFRLLDVNSAYNASHIGHYALAWLGMVLLARSLGLKPAGAAFAALVYVYGWFPARSCLEWAIIGGAWLPFALWCAERFAATSQVRFLAGLAATLALQMLAGHYHIAFITQLTIAAFAYFRTAPSPNKAKSFRRSTLPVWLAMGLAFGLAAVQLVPTWELRQHSQRSSATETFDPGYGHIPPLYWSQAITPWLWYSPDVDLDRAISSLKPLAISSGTNRVEAHLYLGFLPAILLMARITLRRFVPFRSDRRWNILAVFGLVALVYTSGWLIPVTRRLPGFGFFMGPGRYGLITTLAAAILAGATLEDLTVKLRPFSRAIASSMFFILTAADLWYVGQAVGYAVMIERPPILLRDRSPVAAAVRDATTGSSIPRLLAPGPNMVSNAGVAATPVYLGLAPDIYFGRLAVPPAETPIEREARISWLREAAVTHILSFETLNTRDWPVELVWSGIDPLLNPAWARFHEPIYLYALTGANTRASLQSDSEGTVTITAYEPDRVVLDVVTTTEDILTLRDLDDPGWKVAVNDTPTIPLPSDHVFRSVPIPAGNSRVVWTYEPASVQIGAIISLAAAMIMATTAFVVRRRASATETTAAR